MRRAIVSILFLLASGVAASAQTHRYDHVHLAAADPAKAVDWYIKNIGARPGDAPDRVLIGRTIFAFIKRDGSPPQRQGRIGITRAPFMPIVGVLDEQSPAGKLGLRTGDVIISIDGQPIDNWSDVARGLGRGARNSNIAYFRGTPIPGVIPLPGQPMPPKPSATVAIVGGQAQVTLTSSITSNPGFPFFVPGVAGHRPPKPPMDTVPGSPPRPERAPRLGPAAAWMDWIFYQLAFIGGMTALTCLALIGLLVWQSHARQARDVVEQP